MDAPKANATRFTNERERTHFLLACRQVEIALGHMPYAIFFAFLNAVLLVILLRDRICTPSLCLWLGALAVVMLLRFGLVLAFRKRKSFTHPDRWASLLTAFNGMAGILWGLIVPLFGPELPETYQAFLLLLLGGTMAAASVFQASVRSSSIAFLSAASLPSIVVLALLGQTPLHATAAIMLTFFTILILILAIRVNTTIKTSVTMELRNERLIGTLRTSEERFRTLTENSASAVFIIQDDRFVYLNTTGQRIIGYSLKELQNMGLMDIVHPEHRDMVRDRAAKRLSGGQAPDLPKRYEIKLLHKDGHTIWIDFTPGVLIIDGQPAILGTAFDITDKKLVEEKRIISEKRFRMLFNNANDPMFLIELSHDLSMGIIKDVNEAACNCLGYSREELIGKSPEEINAEENPNLFRAILAKLTMDGNIVYETELRSTDGSVVPVEMSSHMTRFEGRTIVHSIARDITLRKQLTEKLTELANTDPLTGCLNRRSFWSRGAGELDRSKRYDRPLVMLMIDIDHFKAINDTYGHSMGDVVLRSLVTRGQAELRATDVFGRVGGEEFAALLVETDMDEARAVAERIRLALQQTRTSYGVTSVSCTVSIGVAEALEEDQQLDDLVNRADKALYHAKQTGRNRVVTYSDMPETD